MGILEENKQKLTDVIIKTAELTHNTSVNKAGFSPLQLAIGKATKIPELTMGIIYNKSLIDAKVNEKIMETKNKITQLFREAEPRKRLKDYQKIPIRTGDKIGCQHNDAWHNPAETINQKDNTILAYFNEEMRKVAMCRTKPHEQTERIKETRETENHEKIENSKTNKTKIDDIIDNNKIESEKENENDTGTGQKIEKIDAKHLLTEKKRIFYGLSNISSRNP